MIEKSLGVVIPGGSGPVRATSNRSDPTAAVMAHSYRVQHWPGNAGRGYVGDSSMITATGDGCFGYLPLQSDAPPLFYQGQIAEPRLDPTDMSAVYIDADVATDGFLITYIEA